MKKRKFKISGRLILNLAVAALCIWMIFYFLYSEQGLYDLLASPQGINSGWIFAALLSYCTSVFADVLVIYLYIHDEYKQFKIRHSARSVLLGLFWSAITPSSTGGQPMQVYYMSKHKVDVGYSSSRLLNRFLVYQITMTVMTVIAVILKFSYFQEHMDTPILSTLVTIGFISQTFITLVFVFLAFSKKLTAKATRGIAALLCKVKLVKDKERLKKSLETQLAKFHTGNRMIFSKPKLVLAATLLTVVQLIAMFMVPYFIYRSFGLSEASPFDMVCSQAFVTLISGMIPIPGASGAAEFSFTALFALFFTPATIKSATLIWRIITYYLSILVGAPFAYMTKTTKRNKLLDDLIADEEAFDSPESDDEEELSTSEDEKDDSVVSEKIQEESPL